MSSIKRQPTVLLVAAVLAALWLCPCLSGEDDPDDPVLRFYCQRAAEASVAGDPIEHGVSFAYTATSYYKRLSSEGEVEKVDSSVVRRFFSSGSLDSAVVEVKTSSDLDDVNLDAPDVFADTYKFTFFPNDTGGRGLAIGFDTDSLADPLPVGLAVIDRDKCLVRRLHLFYPDPERHKRVSRSFRMIERDGYVFPDSVWEIGTNLGVFSLDVYRLETGISDLEVFR